MNVTARTGKVVGAEIVEKDDQLVAMTQSGKAIRLRVKTIRTVGRIAQGVKLIDLKRDDEVVSIARVVTDAEDGDGE
jgi:DNA gyrase subunit A